MAKSKDPVKAKAAAAKKSDLVDDKTGKIMVEKKDGSIGEWGNPIKPTPPRTYRTYPKGEITQDDVDYAKSLNDPKVNKVADRYTQKGDGSSPQYGPEDSDVMRAVVSRRAKAKKK